MSTPCQQCGNTVDVDRFCSVCGAEQLTQAPESDPLIGRVFAERYRVTELINSGGMGRIYRGVQQVLDRPVAIKCIHPDLVTEEAVAARFLEEAQVASRLNHPNIVSIYDFGRTSMAEGGYPFLVMELLAGTDLMALLKSGELMPVEHVVDVLEQTLAALAEAHEHGIAHRDIKPGNLMLEPRRRGGYHVKVIDFGIARLRDSRRLTQVGMLVGTPEYMSPEQLRGEDTGPKVDLWAVSVLLYRLLTGSLPFEGKSPLEIIRQHVMGVDTDPRSRVSEGKIPDALAEFCIRALHPEANERYPDAVSMATALVDAGLRPKSSGVPQGFRPSLLPPSTEETAATVAYKMDKATLAAAENVDLEHALLSRTPWAKELLEAEDTFLVWGRPGIGRSWVLEQATKIFEKQGADIYTVTPPPAPSNEVGYRGLREAISILAEWTTEGEARAAIETVKTPTIRDALEAVFGGELAKGVPPGKTRAGAVAALRFAAKSALVRSDERVILVIDDVDHLDGASLLAVADLIAGEPISGLTLIMTASSSLENTFPDGVTRRELRGWSRAEAQEKLGTGDIELERDGDIEPMYVAQLVADSDGGAASVPETLMGVIEQRLRGLPPDALCTLQAVAVCGPSKISTLADVVEHPEDVDGGLLPLDKLGLIRVEAGVVHLAHALYGRATVAMAPAGVIAALHEKAAEASERGGALELQAHHEIRSRPGFEAFLLVEECARLRQLRGDGESAKAVLRDGIDAARMLMHRDADEVAKSGWLVFGSKLGQILADDGSLEEATEVLSETLDLTSSTSSARAHVLKQLSRVAAAQGREVQAELLSQEAIEIAELVGERDLALELRRNRDRPITRRPRAILPLVDRTNGSGPSGPAILIVEDDRAIARALQRWLRRRGYSVTACHSMAEANEVEGKFACGIFDVLLPDGTGLELAEDLLDQERVAAAVFFTGSDEASVALIAESLGSMVRKTRGVIELETVVEAAILNARDPEPEPELEVVQDSQPG